MYVCTLQFGIEGGGNKRGGVGKSLKVNKREIAISGGGGGKIAYLQLYLAVICSIHSLITERMMRKLVLTHANIFQNNKQWPKSLTMKYFHRTIPGLVWTVCSWLTILISRGGGGCSKSVLVCIF